MRGKLGDLFLRSASLRLDFLFCGHLFLVVLGTYLFPLYQAENTSLGFPFSCQSCFLAPFGCVGKICFLLLAPCGPVAVTSASHAEGCQLDPGLVCYLIWAKLGAKIMPEATPKQTQEKREQGASTWNRVTSARRHLGVTLANLARGKNRADAVTQASFANALVQFCVAPAAKSDPISGQQLQQGW